tara:strand:- start:555 stop:1631 length:1077 start_codon:yes stop_codon:yes gene_type:complete
MQINPQISNLPTYKPGKALEEVARELNLPLESLVKLASNENPLGPSPKSIAAAKRALEQIHLYPDGNAFRLRNVLAKKLNIDPEQLIFGNGSNEIIEFLAHALLKPGTNIVVSQFCFAIYPIVARLAGADCITVPAKYYGHDLPKMTAAITPETRIVFVANPNNPTGTLAPECQILELIENTPEDVLIVIDEAYYEYLNEPTNLLPLLKEKPNLLIMRTFSKIYGLAGLRVGYGIGHPPFVAALEKIRQPFNLNSVAQAAAIAAIEDAEHLIATRSNNFKGLNFLENNLKKLGIKTVPSFANFILAEVGNAIEMFEKLQKRGIITRPMDGYKLPEWIRISVGSTEENIRCIEMIEELY